MDWKTGSHLEQGELLGEAARLARPVRDLRVERLLADEQMLVLVRDGEALG